MADDHNNRNSQSGNRSPYHTDLSAGPARPGINPAYTRSRPITQSPSPQPTSPVEREVSSQKPAKKKRSKSGLLKWLLILVAVIVLVSPGIFFWRLYKNQQKIATNTPQQTQTSGKQDDGQLSKEQIAALLERINKLYILPTNEEPIVATVTNVDELKKSQPFYTNAENGDIVLVYSQNKLAIIYSPTRNKIANVGSVTVDGTTPTDASNTKTQ